LKAFRLAKSVRASVFNKNLKRPENHVEIINHRLNPSITFISRVIEGSKCQG